MATQTCTHMIEAHVPPLKGQSLHLPALTAVRTYLSSLQSWLLHAWQISCATDAVSLSVYTATHEFLLVQSDHSGCLRAGWLVVLQCGYFADKFNRIHMLAFIVVVGEAPCLCTYWVSGSKGWQPC